MENYGRLLELAAALKRFGIFRRIGRNAPEKCDARHHCHRRKVFCTSSTFSHRNLTTFDSGKDFFNVYVLDYSQNLMLSEGSLRKVWLNFRKFRIDVRMDDNQRLTDR